VSARGGLALLASLAVVLSPGPGLAAPPPVTGRISAPALSRLDAFVLAEMTKWRVPGVALAVVQDGRVVAERGYGWRDLERHLPVTPLTVMPIASCTKSFTVATLGALATEGKLEWDRPVRDVMPEFRLYDETASQQVTTRDLVTHRTGLPRHDEVWYRSGLTREEIFRRLRYLEPSQPLRAAYQYQNMMFLVAGMLAGRVAGSSWEDAVRGRLLQPLDMTSTFFSIPDLERQADHAIGYQRDDRDSVVREAYQDLQEIAPAGSMVSSVADLSHYLQMLLGRGSFLGHRVLSEKDVNDMMSPQTIVPSSNRYAEFGFRNYGMGFAVTTYRGHVLAQHSGNMDGFSAFLSLLPRDGIGIAILTNLDQSRLREVIAYRIHDWLTGQPPIDWSGRFLAEDAEDKASEATAALQHVSPRVPDTHPSHPIADYVGEFAHPAYGTITIAPAGDTLQMTFHGVTMPLTHYHYDVFEKPTRKTDPYENLKLKFDTDWDGAVSGLEIAFEPGTHDIVFARLAEARMRKPEFLKSLAGDYELGSSTARVAMRGGELALTISGQPTYTLEPVRGTTFRIKELNGYSIEFRLDASGQAQSAGFFQPDGNYLATRKH
jgi:CubicO group peptidase (beta-lactamase class C family)